MPDEIQDSLLSVQVTGLNLYRTFWKGAPGGKDETSE